MGSYTITAALGSLAAQNYTFQFVSGTLTVSRATPTVTVSDPGGTYTGSTFPATALVNGAASLQGVTPSVAYYAGSLTAAQLASATPLSGAPSAAGTYTVEAAFAGSTDYTAASSSPAHFTITPASPSQLAFTVAPVSGIAGFNLNSPGGVQVSVEDKSGNIVTSDNSTITISIATGPAGGTFTTGSITSVQAKSGVANFTSLAMNLSGSYTLKATDGLLTAVTATVVIQPNAGLLLLDPTGQSLNVSGNGIVNVTNYGAIVVDSSNTTAASASGNASVTAGEIDVKGKVSTSGNAAFHGVVNTGAAAIADPLANLSAPAQPAAKFTAVNYSGTIQPGTYVGGITVSGNNTLTLQSGILLPDGRRPDHQRQCAADRHRRHVVRYRPDGQRHEH